MDDKLRQMEDEMNRFEAEIGGQLVTSVVRPVIGVNTYSQVARQLEQHEIPTPVVAAAAASLAFSPMIGFPPPPPPPPPMLIPPQVARQSAISMSTYSSPAQISNSFLPNTSDNSLSATPKTYEPTSAPIIRQEIIEQIINTKIPEDEGKKKVKAKGVSTAAELAISQGKASSIMANASAEETHPKGKGKKNKKIIRMAGGQTWEDTSLLEWDEDDFRIFCGDLGNDVTDEMLVRVFSKYPSFQKAKVVRDKRTNKTKGFGFVSFKDPQDFIRAMKEMNGRYVGSRPIKLRKSSWKQRNLDSVRKKEKEKQALIGLLTGR
ncbi:RNA-binding protein 42 isoform X1 [Neodiprion pinetum]|uniref:RNA-binding protein 42 n=1 Tax=Neodiprion lecontei TaxID=441921 RepID=A0A6J0C8J6_NEOLC|nr:RNA-binding protein 42 isoform X1 [Neodiprion lecontei]XP_046417254.1 RNA-binding protein 42 isoform X1 [Neodiprion fabricii]XP_046474153.1 RNA-binding protein 42 isoform X1 [Neodiprion pinetum]XP_046611957.1 RNA-binding protein 42 isoform X1 [Neodiprion virginianus]